MREGGDLVVNLDVLDVRVIPEVFHLFPTDVKGGELLLAADALDLALGGDALGLVEAVLVLVLDDEVDPTVGIAGVWGAGVLSLFLPLSLLSPLSFLSLLRPLPCNLRLERPSSSGKPALAVPMRRAAASVAALREVIFMV